MRNLEKNLIFLGREKRGFLWIIIAEHARVREKHAGVLQVKSALQGAQGSRDSESLQGRERDSVRYAKHRSRVTALVATNEYFTEDSKIARTFPTAIKRL